MRRSYSFIGVAVAAVVLASCERPHGNASSGGGGTSGSGGVQLSVGGATENSEGGNGSGASGGTASVSGPQLHPPDGFEDCKHAEVIEDCVDGWCKLPASCFVMGSPAGEWHRARYAEERVAATLTHSVEVLQKELTRAQWARVTGVEITATVDDRIGDGDCFDDNCPVSNMTWWEAAAAADMLSEERGFDPCYSPTNCVGELGEGRTCESVTSPDRSLYECRGYRLPTRAEAEYAARAGTITAFYSGDITVHDTLDCLPDANLERIAWYCYNSGNRIHRGGEKISNRFGLFDILGNVAEWTTGEPLNIAPTGGTDPDGEVGGYPERIDFGGQYNNSSPLLRSANATGSSWNSHGAPVGFRLYRTLFEDSERSGPIIEE